MTREQLEQLSKAELIEIILQQQATLPQQQALIEQLQARVAHQGQWQAEAHLQAAGPGWRGRT